MVRKCPTNRNDLQVENHRDVTIRPHRHQFQRRASRPDRYAGARRSEPRGLGKRATTLPPLQSFSMSQLHRLYRDSLALLTDLYQLTMAYGYWKLGRAQLETVFHLTFRQQPFDGGFSIACGLHDTIEFVEGFQFAADDVDYLRTLNGNDGKPLFADAGFFDFLSELRLRCDVDAMPEGTAAFPNEPLVRVRGPILQCQLLETALLNL